MTDRYLSYSGWKKLTTCRRQYWHIYVNKTPALAQDRLGAVFGIVVGRLFEQFYNEELWRLSQPQGELVARAPGIVGAVLREQVTATNWFPAGTLLWKGTEEGQNPKGLYSNESEIVAHVREAVANGFQAIREHRLLGLGAKAEVKLDHDFEYRGCTHRLAGRADFVIRRVSPHNDLVIVDGKGSRWGSLWSDSCQLWWYAMLYRAHHGHLPDKVGFLYWTFRENAVEWKPIETEVIDQLQESVLSDLFTVWEDPARGVDRFPSSPSEDNCKFCPYVTADACPEGSQEVPCHH